MPVQRLAARVAVSVQATDSGDTLQVTGTPTGFQGVTSDDFSDGDLLVGALIHENGEDWEEYGGADSANHITVASLSGTVTLTRPSAPVESSNSDARISLGSGTHTFFQGLTAADAKRLLRETNPTWKQFASGDSTPSVADHRFFETQGSTTITAFDDAATGQRFLVYRGDADITIQHGASLKLFGARDLTLTEENPAAEFVEKSGVIRQVDGARDAPNKDDATTAPTTDWDDSDTAGVGVKFAVGSRVIDTSASPKEVYRCVDASTGAAVWVNTSLEVGELGALAVKDTIDTLSLIAAALRSGSDSKLITGTAGTNGNLVQWNADGDAVDSGVPAADVSAEASVDDYTALKALEAGKFTVVMVADSVRGGLFAWRSDNQSANITKDPGEGIWVPPGSDTSGASGAWERIRSGFGGHAAWWGAVGDNSTDDTTAWQNAFIWLAESEEPGQIYGAGRYYVTDELTAGTMSNGKTVAKHIADAGLDPSGNLEQFFGIRGDYAQLWFVVDENFSSTETNWIDKVLFRFEQPQKNVAGPVVHNVGLYADMDRADRRKCPVGLKLNHINHASVEGIIARGKEYEWYNTAVLIEECNNSHFENGRIKAGFQYTYVDLFESTGGNFNITDDGSANTGARIVDADGSGAFANPGSETDAFWDDLYFMLSEEAATGNYDAVVVKTKSSGAKVDNNTLDLDPSYAAEQNANGVNVSIEMIRGAITSGDNTLTLVKPDGTAIATDAGPWTSDDVGRMIHVFGAGANDGLLSAYIGTVTNSTTVELTQSDGTTPANASATVTSDHVICGCGIYYGRSYEFSSSSGNNNDAPFVNWSAAKCRGAGWILQRILSSHIVSGKAHARSPSNTVADQQVTECGYPVIFDECRKLHVSDFLLTWATALDSASEETHMARIVGSPNSILYDNYDPAGVANKTRVFVLDGTAPNTTLKLGDGESRLWEPSPITSDMDRDLFRFRNGNDATSIEVRGKCISGTTSIDATDGPVDLLERFKRYEHGLGERVTISGGSINVSSSLVYVDGEGGANDDLDTINGLRGGQEVLLGIEESSHAITIKDGTGNIQLLNGDITLDRTREFIRLIRDQEGDLIRPAQYYPDLSEPGPIGDGTPSTGAFSSLTIGGDTAVAETNNSFTPTMEIGGTEITAAGTPGSYSTQTGSYVLQGDLVWVFVDIALSAVGSATGSVTIPLPAAIEPTSGSSINWMTLGVGNVEGLNTAIAGEISASAWGASTDGIRLRKPTSGGTAMENVDEGDLTDSFRIQIAGVYRKV